MARPDDPSGPFYANGRNLPSWVRGAAYLIGMLGFPILVAGYFLARDAGLLRSPLTEARAVITDIRAAMTTHVAQEESRNRVLRLICRHTARTESEARDCDPPRGGLP